MNVREIVEEVLSELTGKGKIHDIIAKYKQRQNDKKLTRANKVRRDIKFKFILYFPSDKLSFIKLSRAESVSECFLDVLNAFKRLIVSFLSKDMHHGISSSYAAILYFVNIIMFTSLQRCI